VEGLADLARLLGPIWSRLALSVLVLVGALVLRWAARRAIRRQFAKPRVGEDRPELVVEDRHGIYWLNKLSGYAIWAVAALLIVLIWTQFGGRLGFVAGLFSAGVAFALQSVLASVAGWTGILANKTFRVGERVMMGGVRGDVIDLSPLTTTIMEIGSPGSPEDSDVWVNARQYTGRVVTVTNKAFFDEPVYNYSQGFDYIWEEITVPVTYTSDWEKARRILLEETEGATRDFREASAAALAEMARRYLVPRSDVDPQTFVKLTDNWIELTARFVIPTRSARKVKSAISEGVLRRFTREDITIASATSEIVGLPPLHVELSRDPSSTDGIGKKQ
jgi:small-conductance mechanosensitive channel